ncbi:hypothetical protein CS0771_77460 [Catellatospora sp. IY07-71]|uniref:DUF6158 family protein n=1 Tax=Catellatospora sp. IY07-71 TaxID=2728827 RepID=UPI001BB6EC61|nr:DUF6158 family protein [Catellatospora sp. IY07-71]BCJ78202.1 hypothetical protein CS0771_77460 [Catellatospora sp. IY07-71]
MRDYDEVVEIVYAWQQDTGEGVPARDLSDEDLFRELAALYRTRLDSLRHASDQALTRHTTRTVELETDYVRRFPDREINPDRLRSGARTRS